jgi:alpha-N-arabinofuranosidase
MRSIKRTHFFILVMFSFAIGLSAIAQENQLIINADIELGTINKNIYGHFAEHLGGCVYGGIWVGEDSDIPNTRGIRNDVVEALKEMNLPVLRWPGGCFADEYHWKDGIGPKDQRPPMLNTHWGMIVENNHFGTHEFLDLCEMLDTEPYICGNVGSGSVREMQDWVEYVTYDGDTPMANLRRKNGREKPWKVKYWGVGNESWGCGGNMKPEYYADLYLRYQTYLRNLSGNRLFKIACGSSGGWLEWTEVLMKKARRQMNGLSLHYYCGTGKNSRSATKYKEEDWIALLKRALEIDNIISSHEAIMDRYDPRNRVGLLLDEWGAWHEVEPGTNPGFLYQQNSIRDALVAALTLNIFNEHNERVQMANIAQIVNVLQSMILTKDEKMVKTPTFHVFEMYKKHQDAQRLSIDLDCETYQFDNEEIPALHASASRANDDSILITICNFDPKATRELQCEIRGIESQSIKGRVLTADTITGHNTFDSPDTVKPEPFSGFKKNDDGSLTIQMPSKSVVALQIQ